jgi:hypothetical protein
VPERRAVPRCGHTSPRKQAAHRRFEILDLKSNGSRAAGLFSLFISFWRVFRFSPRRSAAPPFPAILPKAAIKGIDNSLPFGLFEAWRG